MSTLQQPDKVIALLCSDIHISQKPPRARRGEPSWFGAMANTLNQLKGLANHYSVPILCAGDIFDHWRADPELINFAINYLPEMYAIPGQHDLPLHNIDLMERSAYWTMVLIGRITPVTSYKAVVAPNNMVIHGFPWGTSIKPFEKESKKDHVALCHEYFWEGGHCFPTAPKANESKQYKDRIKGWHSVAFGDNHKGFLTEINKISVLNCGTLMRRKSDEVDYRPQIGLLCRSGKIIIQKLKIKMEKFTTLDEEFLGTRKMMRVHDLGDFMAGLTELQHKTFDFIEAIEFAMEEKIVKNSVRELIVESLGRGLDDE